MSFVFTFVIRNNTTETSFQPVRKYDNSDFYRCEINKWWPTLFTEHFLQQGQPSSTNFTWNLGVTFFMSAQIFLGKTGLQGNSAEPKLEHFRRRNNWSKPKTYCETTNWCIAAAGKQQPSWKISTSTEWSSIFVVQAYISALDHMSFVGVPESSQCPHVVQSQGASWQHSGNY